MVYRYTYSSHRPDPGWHAVVADRYTYVPSIGIFIMAVWSIPTPHNQLGLRALVVVACAVIVTLTVMTWVQASYWRDSRTLFTHACRSPKAIILPIKSWNVLETEKNDLDAALKLYRSAAKEQSKVCKNRNPRKHRQYLGPTGPTEDALAELKYAMDMNPSSSTASNSMGSIMRRPDKMRKPQGTFNSPFRFDPDNIAAQINCGIILVKLGRWNEAIAQLARLLALRLTESWLEPTWRALSLVVAISTRPFLN